MTLKNFCATAPLAFAVGAGAFATNAWSDDEIGVKVAAPVVHEVFEGREFDISRTHHVTMSVAVNYSDLDLRRGEDLDQLKKQLKSTARDVCAQRGLRTNPSDSEILNPEECYRNAMRDARRQLDLAIARSNANNLAQAKRDGKGG